MPGKVYLVGAGPGDIGLLTVKGLRCLERAETVVYDFHLNAQILSYISHSAELIYAGKRGGRHSMTQEDINKTLVEKGLAGKLVCRLKGGDPFVFGRGGEEAEALANAGVEFEVVPGVSSSIAAPAYAGIPLTHRNYSSTFAVIPGYEDATKEESAIDWPKLATGVGTLVFLMAVKNLDVLVNKLIENGKSPETPVAIVRWGTRADQTTLVGTLGDITEKARVKEVKPPAVIVIGEVVRLRETLNWYEKKPLFGQRVLVTRESIEGFEPLEDLGAEVISFPAIKVVPPEDFKELDSAINNISKDEKAYYDWIVFTSGSGVRHFFDRYKALGRDIRDLRGLKLCAVGPKTAEALWKFGLKVDIMPKEFNAESLAGEFADMGGVKGKRLLFPRAENARDIFPKAVRDMGGIIDAPVAYRSIKPLSHGMGLKRFLREGRITIATFASAQTFRNLIDIMGDEAEELLRGVKIAAIGPVTAKTIEKHGLKVDIMPSESTVEALVAEIIKTEAALKRP